MASFCAFFPLDVLDEIWDVIESFSEGFLTYFYQNIRELCFLLSFSGTKILKNCLYILQCCLQIYFYLQACHEF